MLVLVSQKGSPQPLRLSYKATLVLRPIGKSSPLLVCWLLELQKRELEMIGACQGEFARRILALRPSAGESAGEYCHRANSAAKLARAETGVDDWAVHSLRLRFGWGEHVSRLPPNRLTQRILHYRNKQWITAFAAQFHGNQQHGRHIHVWRWERALTAIVGTDWERQAQVAVDWKTRLPDLAAAASVLR